MSVDGKVLYELIDTPGFQRARAALDWLNRHCNDVSQRADAIAEFCRQQAENSLFKNECELLQPIVKGAGIIYVVDGSRPYGPEYEAEMEILRWTGRPSLAIVNPIDSEDYVGEWENALGQYFKTVRIFNAHHAEFAKRTSLLNVFGQLQPQWEHAIKQAVVSIQAERERQHRQASELIASVIVEILQHRESQRSVGEKLGEGIRKVLAQKYQSTLRQRESRCRRQVEETYAYYRLQRQEANLELEQTDLFNQESWYLFGLSKRQLVSVAASAGAGAGLLVDVGLGGHSLLLGSVIGGLGGGLSALTFSKQIAKLSIKGLPTGGQIIHYGPVNHPNFPFVVLGRALYHLQLICQRTHANRDNLTIEESRPFTDFGAKDKTQLMGIFKNLSNNKRTFEQRDKLVEIIYQFARRVDGEDKQ
jgi:hypothetical protein